MSEQLFRFVLLRPPVKQDLLTPSITLLQSSDFQQELDAKIKDNPNPRPSMVEVCNNFYVNKDNKFKDTKFIKDPTADELAKNVMALGQNWVALKKNLRDTLIAIKFIQKGPADELASVLRDMELIERLLSLPVATDKEFYQYRERSLRLPDKFEPRSLQAGAKIHSVVGGAEKSVQERNERICQLLEKRSTLSKAYDEISDMPAKTSKDSASRESFHAKNGDLSRPPLGGNLTSLVSRRTKSTLQSYGLDADTTPTTELLTSLRQEFNSVNTALLDISTGLELYTTHRIGNAVVATPIPTATKLRSLILQNSANMEQVSPLLAELTMANDVDVTVRKGKLYSVVADLIVVRQQLKGYELADISTVQNVLKGENKKQEHTSTRKIEDSIFTESENMSNIENENSSTSRYEVGQESTATIKEDVSAKGTLNATTYGPMYSVSASMEGAASRSKEQVNKTASKFSRDIVERTVKKITERTLRRHTKTITSESVDKESREFNNAVQAATNVSGIYQYLNKVYEAQCWNYGTRMMLDLMVPEPASLLIASMTKAAQDSSTTIIPPIPFTITADKLTELDYMTQAGVYQATGISPPPDKIASVTAHSSRDGLSVGDNTSDSGSMQIPEGYEATRCFVSILTDVNDKGERVLLNVGTQTALTAHEGGEDKTFDLAHETGSLPWAIEAWALRSYSVNFTLQCERSVAKFQEWQQATYAKILSAYESKLAQYEQRIKSAGLEADAVAEARNSATNQQIIHEELRKHSISIIRRDAYKNVGALGAGEQGIPDIDFDKAAEQGAVVRFFEQAFEWEQMSYALYGYYWGQRAKWLDRLRFNDPDTTLNEFLKAGMCRVVVPVRGGYEDAVDHLLEHNELWTGGPLPPIASSTYLPIADELAARARKPGAEEAQGLPWDVYVPTSLVQLRAAGQLPKWERNADGVWKSSPAV
ncbi:MAG: hypothetical protein LQ344_005768 [Seirophora lacunosa]|nr:MAG: hypothetical protein LQ344_005768 [Seirophora lacunosa]